MGGLCSCLSPDRSSFEERYPSGSFFLLRDCLCLRSCLPWLFNNSHYTTNFDDVEHQDPNLSSSGAGSSTLDDTSMIPEAFQAPPPPLPYDTDPRSLRSSARRDKSGGVSRHFEPGGGGGARRVDLEEDVKLADHAKTTGPASKAFPRVESALSILDDDDVCPTCLDGYTDDNPRITTACCHSYHLSCIYEWMERSNRCPVCDKEMIFSESV